MKLLVFGKTGQVATELTRIIPDAFFAGHDKADLSDPKACARLIADYQPDLIINAAAYTAVDKAETDEVLATVINGDAPAAMAVAARDIGAGFVHISTDYVFDGSGAAAWNVTDQPAPLGIYGRSKLAGETEVRTVAGVHAILRTAWVFSAHGNNFVKTMLRLSQTHQKLTVVADQYGGPTPAADIARTALSIGQAIINNNDLSGTYHYSGGPDVSWAEFARAIFAQADVSVAVEDIPTSAYPTPAKRPANSRLDCSNLMTAFGIPRPDWRVGLRKVISELETQ